MYRTLITTALAVALLVAGAALELPYWQLLVLAALAGVVWNFTERFRQRRDHAG